MARTPRTISARDALIEENIGLVVHIARRIARRMPNERDRDELVAAGMVGLVEAASRFDPTRGMTFSSFAGLRIEGAILDALRQADRLPRGVRTMQRAIEAAEVALTSRLGRAPSSTEVADACNVTVPELHAARAQVAAGAVDSLDRQIGEERGTLGDLVADPSGRIDDLVADREAADEVRAALGHLSERHRFVILGCMFEGRQLHELATALGVTRSRVSQLKDEAIRQLRAHMADRGTIDLTQVRVGRRAPVGTRRNPPESAQDVADELVRTRRLAVAR